VVRSSRRLVRVPIAVLAAATVASGLAACGGSSDNSGSGSGGSDAAAANEASDVGVTADSVSVGAHFPLTGVAAPGYSEIPTGAQAYFDFVNAAGGVNGRTINYKFLDDGYNPTNTSQVTNQLVLDDQIFAMVGGLGTPTHSAVIDFLNDEGVPDLFVSSGSLLWDDPKGHPTTFGWQPDYEIEGKIIGQYIAENFPDAKVGLFLQDDDFGDNGEKGIREYIDGQVVGAQRYTPGNTDVGPQIAALKAAGADFVAGFNVPSYTALSQLTALQLGYKPQWFYSNVGSDPTLVGSLLNRFSQGKVTDAALLDGALTTEYLPSVDQADNPWTQLFQKVWDASGQEGELTNYRIYGMAEAYTFVQALQAAGQNPTRAGLVDALEQAGGDFEGPALAPFRYSADRHAGIGGMLVSQITGTSSEAKTPVLVTDNGKGDITEYGGKAATPPASGIPDVPSAEN
jgi:branched-chain amino acid transport system substrate-binding protein